MTPEPNLLKTEGNISRTSDQSSIVDKPVEKAAKPIKNFFLSQQVQDLVDQGKIQDPEWD